MKSIPASFITISTLILNSCSPQPALASLMPIEWSADGSRNEALSVTVGQGETRDLVCTLKNYGRVVSIPTNATAGMWWQTNGMARFWWPAPATVTTSGVVSAVWRPEYDMGAPAYTIVLGVVDGTNRIYTGYGVIRMRTTPGYVPNSLAIPQQIIDFGAISYTNAPWSTPDDIDAAIAAILEDDPVATPIATNALAQAQSAHTAATNAQASASVAYTVGTNAVAIATTANTAATNAAAQAQAAKASATNALDILYGLATNGSVWASTIIGNPTNCWLDIVEEVPYIHRQTATADIVVVSVANGEMYFQAYNGPPVGTVWKSTGSDTWAATNGWILTRQAGDAWWIQGESMPPVSYMSPEGSEPPATLVGMDFGNGSLVIDWVYSTEASRLLEAPDVETLAPSNWVESVRGVWTDVATNVTYSVVVSNGHWLVREVK